VKVTGSNPVSPTKIRLFTNVWVDTVGCFRLFIMRLQGRSMQPSQSILYLPSNGLVAGLLNRRRGFESFTGDHFTLKGTHDYIFYSFVDRNRHRFLHGPQTR
jgi:hypothetical protein